MLDKIQIYISLLAALTVTISAGLIEHLSLPKLLFRLVWVIIVFYFIGLVARHYLKKKVFIEKQENADNTEETEADAIGEESEAIIDDVINK